MGISNVILDIIETSYGIYFRTKNRVIKALLRLGADPRNPI